MARAFWEVEGEAPTNLGENIVEWRPKHNDNHGKLGSTTAFGTEKMGRKRLNLSFPEGRGRPC